MSALSVLPMNHIFELGCTVLTSIYSNATLYINDKLARFLSNIKEYKPEYMSVVPLFMEKFYATIVADAKEKGIYEDVLKRIDQSHELMANGIDKRREIFEDLENSFGCPFPKLACGGAPVNPEKSKFLAEIGFKMFIGYGLTETSPVAALNHNSWANTAAVGIPFSETQVYIDAPDKDGNGEIWIKGTNVAKGYFKDEQADKVSFVDGWFKTGDYGKIGEQGELYITGRKKNLIILENGKNVFPEEIETVFINSVEEIKEAVVFEAPSKADKDKNVLVISVSMPGDCYNQENVSVLTAQMKEVNKKLPSYKKIQEYFVVDHEFIRTSTKKIIRKKVEEEYAASMKKV